MSMIKCGAAMAYSMYGNGNKSLSMIIKSKKYVLLDSSVKFYPNVNTHTLALSPKDN